MSSEFWYGLLADLIVVVHFAYVAFIVLGEAAILLGGALGWRWVRNRTFRITHLAMIGVVALEALIGMTCPLTTWEAALRRLAGSPQEEASFMARWAARLIFVECPEGFFTAVHIVFAVLVVGSLWLVPPRWRREPVL